MARRDRVWTPDSSFILVHPSPSPSSPPPPLRPTWLRGRVAREFPRRGDSSCAPSCPSHRRCSQSDSPPTQHQATRGDKQKKEASPRERKKEKERERKCFPGVGSAGGRVCRISGVRRGHRQFASLLDWERKTNRFISLERRWKQAREEEKGRKSDGTRKDESKCLYSLQHGTLKKKKQTLPSVCFSRHLRSSSSSLQNLSPSFFFSRESKAKETSTLFPTNAYYTVSRAVQLSLIYLSIYLSLIFLSIVPLSTCLQSLYLDRIQRDRS